MHSIWHHHSPRAVVRYMHGHSQRATAPDAAHTQLDLPKMSTTTLKTCKVLQHYMNKGFRNVELQPICEAADNFRPF